MENSLIIIGSSAHVLRGYKPSKSYSSIVLSTRGSGRTIGSQINVGDRTKTTFFNYDISGRQDYSYKNLLQIIGGSHEVDIIFAAYEPTGLCIKDAYEEKVDGLVGNLLRPLELFGMVSEELNDIQVNGIFISSMYGTVSPNRNLYGSNSSINPLLYGAAKAGVEQGLRWLSCQNERHFFNSIALGALPKDSVQESSPGLIRNLKSAVPGGALVEKKDLYQAIDFLLGQSGSIRGATIRVDQGYTIW